jgi:hypothetical protein
VATLLLQVVELEIQLDEIKEQYSNVIRNSNSKAQQKKMVFLERNLEQLTIVQKQLVDQNTALKKEAGVAERKLLARNERIQNLEVLLTDADRRLAQQNQKFEMQLNAVKERLDQARGTSFIPSFIPTISFLLTTVTTPRPSSLQTSECDVIKLWQNCQTVAWRWGCRPFTNCLRWGTGIVPERRCTARQPVRTIAE